MHKFIHLSNEYGIETASYKLITETSSINNAETKDKLMGKTLLYIYTRKNHELFKLLRRIAKTDEALCPTRVLKGKMGPFTDAVFLDDESLISFVEAGFLESIKGTSVWADLNKHSKEILKRKGVKINTLPHDSPLTTDIRFILGIGENLQVKKVAI